MNLQFSDRLIPFDVFVNAVADAVFHRINRQEPEFISQNEAFRRFGRANVERWRRTLKIEPCKRPGKIEYRLSELHRLQETKQDYFQ